MAARNVSRAQQKMRCIMYEMDLDARVEEFRYVWVYKRV